MSPLAQQSRILDADGKLIANPYDENRIIVPLKKINKNMQNAQIAIEDSRFYEHGGLDVRGFSRAMISNLQGGDVQGASTLTQQFVKITLQENALKRGDKEAAKAAIDKTYSRKLQELKYALNVEENFTKDQILEGYLNLVYYGDQAYGVEAAALNYFGVSASKLNLGQAALLAGIVQQPTAYNPVLNPKESQTRRNIVLDRMQSPWAWRQRQGRHRGQEGRREEDDQEEARQGRLPPVLAALLLRLRHRVPPEVAADGGPRQDPGRPAQDDQPGRADHPHHPEAEPCRRPRRRRSPRPSRSATSRTSAPRPRSSSPAPARSSRWPRPPTSTRSQTNINVDQKYGGGELGYQFGSTAKMFAWSRRSRRGCRSTAPSRCPFADGKKGHEFKDKALLTVQVRRQQAVVGQERLRQRRQEHDAR